MGEMEYGSRHPYKRKDIEKTTKPVQTRTEDRCDRERRNGQAEPVLQEEEKRVYGCGNT